MNRKLRLTELGRITPEEYKKSDKNRIIIVLDNIRSHHNVGSIFRTADAFLIEKIILCGYTPLPPHREIHKTALGATESVDWQHSEKTGNAVLELKKAGYKVFAVEQTEQTVLLNSFDPGSGPVAVVFGNEVGGIEQEVIDLCDGVVEVPQAGTKHSLNISVCAGVVLWELVRKSIL
jgi:23S rRNA (guanosine2251-2'-O)-methyltransferase